MKALLASLAMLPAAGVRRRRRPAAGPAGTVRRGTRLRAARGREGFRDSFYAYFADDGIAFNPASVSRARRARRPALDAAADGRGLGAGLRRHRRGRRPRLEHRTARLRGPQRPAGPARHVLLGVEAAARRELQGRARHRQDTPSAVVAIDEPPHSSWRAGRGAAARSRPRGGTLPPCSPSSERSSRPPRRRASGARTRPGSRTKRACTGPASCRSSAGSRSANGRPRRPADFAARRCSPTSRSRVISATPGAATRRIGDAPEAGYFARVWKKDERDEWRIVMDTVSPVPAGREAPHGRPDARRRALPRGTLGRGGSRVPAIRRRPSRQRVCLEPARHQPGPAEEIRRGGEEPRSARSRSAAEPGRLLQPRLCPCACRRRRTRRSTTSNARSAPA